MDRDVAADAAFQRGNDLFDRGDLQAALAEFDMAYAISPAYQVLYNIGLVNYRLEKWARARRAFELYLQLGGPELSPARTAQVSEVIAELSQKTATLRLMLNVTDAEIHVDGNPVESNEVTGLILEPGEHVVRVSKSGFRPLEQTLRATHGENVRVVLPLARLGSDDGQVPAASPFSAPRSPRVERFSDDSARAMPLWVPWTVTGALAAGWMTTAGLAIKARHDRNLIERASTPAERIDDARQLHFTLAIVSDVLLASTLASAGVSAYLTWWPSSGATDRGASTPTQTSAAAMDGLSVGLAGQF